MAITTASDWKVYDDHFRAGYAEKLTQSLRVIIERGNGAIVVEDENIPGDYLKESFWKFPTSLVTRRVATGTGSTSAVTPVTVSQGEAVHVRLSRKIGPVDATWDAFRKIAKTPEEFSMVLGGMIAEARLQAMLNDGLTAARAAADKTATKYDKAALTNKTMTRAALAAGMKLMGDAREEVVAWVMHSKPYGDLVDEANTTTAGAESIVTGVALYGAAPPSMGRPIFVTDSSSLVLDETTDKYYSLGLTRGAIRIKVDGQLTAPVIQTVTGLENLVMRIQSEADWFVNIKGYTWDHASGGANPLAAALLTSTNWDLTASDIKLASGVVIKTT